MSRNDPSSSAQRFRSNVRHYHRTGARPETSWDEWTEGRPTAGGRPRRWGLILLLVLGVGLLVAILAGLFIELGPG